MAGLSLANAVSSLLIRCKIITVLYRRASAGFEGLYECDVQPEVAKSHLGFCHICTERPGRLLFVIFVRVEDCVFVSVDHPTLATFASLRVWSQGAEVGFANDPPNDIARERISTNRSRDSSDVQQYTRCVAPLLHDLKQLQAPLEPLSVLGGIL